MGRIFYSWQSDRDEKCNRYLIRDALEDAIKQLKSDTSLDQAIRDETELDHDTRGVPGSPPIVDTIFKKIEQSAVFIGDITYIAINEAGRHIPNPNVLIEYGYAVRVLSYEKIISVMNTAYGSARPEDLPFDMRHLRAPLLYHLEAEADPAATRRAKEKLTRELANRLKVYLKAVPVEAVTQKLYVPEDFGPNAVAPLLGRVTVVGTEIDDYQGRSIDIASGPAVFIRLYPKYELPDLSLDKITSQTFTSSFVLTPIRSAINLDDGSIEDGAIVYGLPTNSRTPIDNFVTVSCGREVWATYVYDTDAVLYRKPVPLTQLIQQLNAAFEKYRMFLSERLGAGVEFGYDVGITGLKGQKTPAPDSFGQWADRGHGMKAEVRTKGVCDLNTPAHVVLEEFYKNMWSAFGLPSRQYTPD